MILLLLAFGALAYIGYFYYRVSKYPKGPFPVPLVGNVLQIKDPNLMHEQLEEWRKKFGDVYTFWMFDEPMVALMRYDPIKDALINHGDALSDRSGRFPDELFQSTPNGGVTFSSGDNWREQRRTAIHILRDFGVGKNVMEEKVQEQIERCIEHIQKETDKNNVDFRWPIQVLVANIINQLLYGFSYPHNNCKRLMNYVERVTKMLKELLDDSWAIVAMALPSSKKLPWLGYKVAGRHHEKNADCLTHVKNDVQDALEYYTTDQEPSCFVQAYYQKIGTSEYLTLPQLYNVCSDFFFAGMETTTTTLRWGLLLLTANPDVQEKIRSEVAKVVGFERLPSMKDKVNMPYTSAFVTELQRVANVFPVNIMRKSNQEITIKGCVLPAGTLFLPQISGSLSDGKIYPDPEILKPERFLKEDGSYNADFAMQTLVFGLGKRQCAGEGLARVELFLTIASFVQKFKFLPSPNAELDLTPVYGIVRFPTEQSLRIEEVDPLAYVKIMLE